MKFTLTKQSVLTAYENCTKINENLKLNNIKNHFDRN